MNKRHAIALFGGSFAPLHKAHKQIAHRALRDLPICRVYLIPNGNPPHRTTPTLSWQERIAACQQFCTEDIRLQVCEDESPNTLRPTVQTLAKRQQRHRQKLILILGADSFATFHRWRRWKQILKIANIAVVRRHNNPRASILSHCQVVKNPRHLTTGVGRVFLWPFRPANISSTQIRQGK
ncbi:MAG: nicotinate (nicotinamide) nucleotide adenylyltransferase [Gammaproteobacteria bacterium WSBS_2016_MAG_OTU1]